MGNIRSSGDITATGVVTAKPCRLWGVTAYAASDDCEFILYDHASGATAPVVDRIKVDFSTQPTIRISYPGIICNNGLYISFSSGTNPKVIVHFETM